MAVTLTKLSTRYPGGNVKQITYKAALDNSWLAAGEPLDMTSDFTYLTAAKVCDSVEGLGVMFHVKKPVSSTAITNSNVLLMAHWSADGTDGEALIAPADATNLGVSYLTIEAEGR